MEMSESTGHTSETLLEYMLADPLGRDRLDYEEVPIGRVRERGLASVIQYREVAAAALRWVGGQLTAVIPPEHHDSLPMCCLAEDAGELWSYDWANAEPDLEIVEHVVRALGVFCTDQTIAARLHAIDEALSVVSCGLRAQDARRVETTEVDA